MQSYTTCAYCGSTAILPDLDVHNHGTRHHHVVTVEADPYALFFGDPVSSDLHAHVCGDCGYTVFFVEAPRMLKEAYQKRLEAERQARR